MMAPMSPRNILRRMLHVALVAGSLAVLCVMSGPLSIHPMRAQTIPQHHDRHERNEPVNLTQDAAASVRQLASRDAAERQRAAEELAWMADAEQRKMLDGYRLQEKNPRVRLALDWALYRIGKAEALYEVVRALNSARGEQAIGYLKLIENPDPLYNIMPRVNGNTQVKILEVLAHVGTDKTLEFIKPYMTSLDPRIADAAAFAEREINIRIAEPPASTPSRQRQVGQGSEEDATPPN